MSWMTSIFGAKPVDQTALQTQQPQNPNDITQQTAQTDANGVVPKQDTKPTSPIDEYNNLWQTPKTNPEETPQEETLTPEKMFEAAGKVDFTKILDQAEVAKIEGGGKDAMQAMVKLLNRTAQATYGQSMVAAKKLVDTAVENASSKFSSKVPDLLRNQTAQSEIYKANPALNNPALAPIIEAIQSQLSKHNPSASAEDLKNSSMKVLQNFANLISPVSKDSTDSKTKGKSKQKEEDWLEWVNQGSDKTID
jgi:hypothetical protein